MVQLEGGDISIEHFLQDHQDVSSSSNSLQQVFQDSTVLLTGATGFLGSLVLEKLLRSCQEVSKIFVTVRGKDDQTAQQRLKELFSTKIFDRVRMEHTESLNKVELLDLDLGLESHAATVTSSVNMVIHCALVTDPEHTMREAVEANIKQSTSLMHLAYHCHKLEAFVVVSSTLGHGVERLVEERFYAPAVTAKAMCIICDTLSEDVFNNDISGMYYALCHRLILNNSSASSITLSLTEHLFRQGRKSLPLAVVRPSMLVASYKEPLAGWLPHSPRGIMRLLTQAMQGRLCALRSDTSLKAELMPVDLAASLVLAVTAHTASARRTWQNKEVEDPKDPSEVTLDYDIPIFNLVSSNQNPLSWKEFFVCSIRHARSVPFVDTAWYPHLILTTSKFWFSLWFYLMHLLPAWIIDSFEGFTENPNILNAKKSRVYQKYQSQRVCCEALTTQLMTSQKYKDHNTQALWRSLSPSDRATFNYHPSQLDWDEYLYTLARGVRLYCLGDSLDTIPRAMNRMRRYDHEYQSIVYSGSFHLSGERRDRGRK